MEAGRGPEPACSPHAWESVGWVGGAPGWWEPCQVRELDSSIRIWIPKGFGTLVTEDHQGRRGHFGRTDTKPQIRKRRKNRRASEGHVSTTLDHQWLEPLFEGGSGAAQDGGAGRHPLRPQSPKTLVLGRGVHFPSLALIPSFVSGGGYSPWF